jgi:CheY-like chemotaxis protein
VAAKQATRAAQEKGADMSEQAATVLVVDDDPFTAELTAMIIEMGGYETIIAEGAVEALQKLEETPGVVLVVSDMNMPLMDGVDLFEELRRQGFTQPFLLITGEDAAPQRAVEAGIDAILTKDDQLQETLPEAVAALLAGK